MVSAMRQHQEAKEAMRAIGRSSTLQYEVTAGPIGLRRREPWGAKRRVKENGSVARPRGTREGPIVAVVGLDAVFRWKRYCRPLASRMGVPRSAGELKDREG